MTTENSGKIDKQEILNVLELLQRINSHPEEAKEYLKAVVQKLYGVDAKEDELEFAVKLWKTSLGLVLEENKETMNKILN